MFRSKEWTEHVKELGIEQRYTLIANPACNGKVKHVHRTMKSILKSYQNPTLWPLFLAQVVLTVNTQMTMIYSLILNLGHMDLAY